MIPVLGKLQPGVSVKNQRLFFVFLSSVSLSTLFTACEVEEDTLEDDSWNEPAEVEERAYVTPTDPQFSVQKWHYDAIRLREAWALVQNLPGVLVAVADSGSMNHEDLQSKWTGGYDFVKSDANPYALETLNGPFQAGAYHHGIHVAGTIGAIANNGKGGVGICWNCSLMPIRTSGWPESPGAGSTMVDVRRRLESAILYAAGLPANNGYGLLVKAAKRADVVNLSLGNIGAPCPTYLNTAINAAAGQGTVVVVAAGNGSDGIIADPPTPDYNNSHYLWMTCNNPNLIIATSTDAAGNVEEYALKGSGITIAAPGGDDKSGGSSQGERINCENPSEDGNDHNTHGIVSAWFPKKLNPTACYRHMSGTSMAAPHVSGVVALMRSKNSTLTVTHIKSILEKTAKKNIPCVIAGQCGAGLVDAYAAVLASTFDASILSCESGQSAFSCGSTASGGTPTIIRKWQGTAYASINANKTTTVLTQGTCIPGKSATVQLTTTDGIGRAVVRSKSFLCSAGPWS